VVNTRSKTITVKLVKNSPATFSILKTEKIPEILPEKEIDISNYFDQSGFVSLFSPRDDLDLKFISIKPILRKSLEKNGEPASLVKLEEGIQAGIFTEEKIVAISGNTILTLKTEFKKTPIQKTDDIKLTTLEMVVRTQILELKDLVGLKTLRSIPITSSVYGKNCRFFNLLNTSKDSLKG